jgi:hypothetical protein
MVRLRTALVLPAIALSGCFHVGDVDGGKLWQEVAATHIPSIIGSAILWAILGVVLAVVAAVGVFFLLRALGAYALPTGGGRWLRVLIIVLMLLALPPLGFFLGLTEGIWRGARTAAHESKQAKEWLPKGGQMCADILAQLDLIVQARQGKKAWEWEHFQQGKQSLEIKALLDQLEQFKGKVGQEISEKLRRQLLANHPDWQGGKAEDVLDWILSNVTQALVDRNLDERLRQLGIQPFFEELSKAAEANDGVMNRQELSQFFTDEVLRPSLLYPVRKTVRAIQTGLWLGVLAVVVVPVALIKLIGLFLKKPAPAAAKREGTAPPIAKA